MKNLIIAFTLIVAVACDVSEIQGDGWSKDGSGYHYDVPDNRFLEEGPEEPSYAPDSAAPGCPNGGSGPFCCINGSDRDDCNLSNDQDDYVEVVEYVDVPVDNLREYLPPQDYKRKRQVPARKQVRKIVRRYVRKH